MPKSTLKPKAKAWEKTGFALLNKYLDTLAPTLREWIDKCRVETVAGAGRVLGVV
jgi:hypothetical protein